MRATIILFVVFFIDCSCCEGIQTPFTGHLEEPETQTDDPHFSVVGQMLMAKWRKDFLLHASPAEGQSFPFVLIGNKAEETHEVSQEQILEFCASTNSVYFECSTKAAEGVDKAFEAVLERALTTKVDRALRSFSTFFFSKPNK